MSSLIDYLAIGISLSALSVSIITFIKKRKSDQFRIALDISDRLEKATDELIQASEIAGNQFTSFESDKRHNALRQPTLHLLNVYEFLSFLVNNGEINNKNIIKYFKPGMIEEIKQIFGDYPDIAQDETYDDIKKLLKKWEDEDKCIND